MVELVRFLAESLVENPEEIQINKIEEETQIIIELKVAPEDMGRIIGKQGKIAKSIRTLIKANSLKNKESKKVILEIV